MIIPLGRSHRATRGMLTKVSRQFVSSVGMKSLPGTSLYTNACYLVADIALVSLLGFEICRQIHASSQVPIIMLTEQGYDMDAERVLAIGADDYMTKPFSYIEFLVKVQAVLHRAQTAHWAPDGIFTAGDLTVNYLTREVWVKGKKVRLTASEFRLLYHLTRSVGKVPTYEELLSKVWGQEFTGKTRRLIVYIQRLRQKLGEPASSPRLIFTEHGVGYGLMAVTKEHSSIE